MPDASAATTEAAMTREGAMFEALVASARCRQKAAQKSHDPPRFLLEGGKAMATHMGMTEQAMHDRLAPMALWQLYLPSVLGLDTWDFDTVRERMPWSVAKVREALQALKSRPQVVSAAFHMAAFPLICVLVGAVSREMHEGPLHLFVASRNMGWFRLERNSWVGHAVEVIDTNPAGLRRLLSGLRHGEIRHLLILADGPQAPGTAGTRALDGISPALGFRTALLAKIHSLGIPVVPITHEWEADRLVVTPRAPLEPAALDEEQALSAMASHIEDLLRRHPEQWLAWNAARIRT